MFGFAAKETCKVMNINDIDKLAKDAALIDIREPYEFRGGSLKTAKNVPMGEILNNPAQYLRKDGTYYLFCQSGARSNRACSYLAKQGYDVVNLAGGMGSYAGTRRS
jgi:rhodanese-related sulfurtransferase